MADEIKEALTIPQNPSDNVEAGLYYILKRKPGWKWGDFVVRWYRNAKKAGMSDRNLRQMFVKDFMNIYDSLGTYEEYVSILKTQKFLNTPIEFSVNGKSVSLVPKDIGKIRRLEGFNIFLSALGDRISSLSNTFSTVEKYALTDDDKGIIRRLASLGNVDLWCTEEYETTNKFIFHLWQNAKTLGRGDVYGDPTEQTPYCTHSKTHWDNYSRSGNPYQQFWFLDRKHSGNTTSGNLNDPAVAEDYAAMKGKGAEILICMNDSGGDLLDRNDESSTYAKIGRSDVESIAASNLVRLDTGDTGPDGVTVPISDAVSDGLFDDFADYDKISEALGGSAFRTLDFYVEVEDGHIVKSYPYVTIFGHINVLKDGEIWSIDDNEEEVVTSITPSLDHIPPYAFDVFGDKLRSVVIPSSVTYIAVDAFTENQFLEKVTFNDGLTEIGDASFSDNHRMKSIVLPTTLEKIGRRSFACCTELERVDMSKRSPKLIDKRAFWWCKNLKEVILGPGLEEIGDDAFSSCESLETIILPDTIRKISYGAFVNCKKMKLVFSGRSRDYVRSEFKTFPFGLEEKQISYGVGKDG